MKRRDFITLIGGAAAWPLAARAQQQPIPVIGYLSAASPEPNAPLVASFRKGLSETRFVEGQNVTLEYRWAHNDLARLPELAADLIRRRVAVIVTPGSSSGALAAKAATATIPIVFWTTTDPVQAGLVSSLSRPGGKVTGAASMGVEIGGKQLDLCCCRRPSVLPCSSTRPILLLLLQSSRRCRQRLRRWVDKSKSSMPAPIVKSTSPLQALCKGGPRH